MNKVTLDKEYCFELPWDGTIFDSEIIAIDTETSVHELPEPQKIVLTTASCGSRSAFIENHQLAKFFEMHQGRHFVFQNVSFDYWVLTRFSEENRLPIIKEVLDKTVEDGLMHDTMLLDILLRLGKWDSRTDARNLGILAEEYAGIKLDKTDPYRIRYGEILGIPLNMVEDRGFIDYAIKDTIATYYVFLKLFMQCKQVALSAGVYKDSIIEHGLLTEKIQVKAAIALQKITFNGFHIDLEYHKKLHAELTEHVREVFGEIDKFRVVDEKGVSQGVFKYNRKTDELILTKTGQPSTSKKVIQELLKQTVADIQSQYNIQVRVPLTDGGKSGNRQIATSIKEWEDYIDKSPFLQLYDVFMENTKLLQFFKKLEVKKVHSRYSVIKKTGRTGAYDPNCQQLPRKDGIREIFTAPEGYFLVFIDYKYIELRTLAAICEAILGYSTLADAIRAGIDPHEYTAAALTNIPPLEFKKLKKTDEKFYDKWRQDAKICFHKDVECLTELGWKKISEITLLDKVIQYNDGKMEFVNPVALQKVENKPLVEVSSRHYSLRVTPDHNMYCLNWDEKPIICMPHEMPRKARKTVHAGHILNETPDDILAIKRAVCIQADGCISKSKQQYIFGFKKRRKIDRFKELFDGLYNTENVCNGVTRFAVPRNEGYEKYLTDKKFNIQELLKCNQNTLEAFIQELYYWDGTHKSSDKHFSYTSVIKQNIDAVQAVASVCGYRTVFNEWIPNLSDNPAYSLSITKSVDARPSTLECKEYSQNETVYCLTVPSHLILTRDKGAVQVVGQCNFGLPGGLSAKSLVYYAKTVYKVEISLEDATKLRDNWINVVYKEMKEYLSEDTLRIVCFNLYTNREEFSRVFNLTGDKDFGMLYCIRNVVKGSAIKKDGTPYSEAFVDRIWRNLRQINNNPSLNHLINNRAASSELEKAIFWDRSVTLTGRVRGKVSFSQCKNGPFQGLAADGVKNALWQLIKEDFHIIAFIHDEIIMEVPDLGGYVDLSYIKSAQKIMEDEMRKLTGNVPIETDFGVSKKWKKKTKFRIEGDRVYPI